LLACMKWKHKFDVDDLKKEMAEKDDDKIIKYQARKEKALAETREIELEKLKGNIVDVETVAREWERIITNIKTKFITLPQIAAPRIVGRGDLKEVKGILKTKVDEILNELAKAK
jgi:hypothetical protein